jgi:hypothetical protein
MGSRDAITAAAPDHATTVRRHFFDHLSSDQVATLNDLSLRVLVRLDF